MAFKFVRSPRAQSRWFEYRDGMEVLLAPSNNNHWMQELFGLIKFNDLARVTSEVDLLAGVFRDKTTAEAHTVVATLTAKTILLDWRGLVDEDGVEIPYSPEVAAELLRLESDFRQFVEQKSHDLFLETKQAAEDVKKK